MSFFYIKFPAQTVKIDSLFAAFKVAKNDTTKMNVLLALVENIDNSLEWEKYNQQAKELAEKLSQSTDPALSKCGKHGLANAINNIGFSYHKQGKLDDALEQFKKSLKINQELGNRSGIALALNNIGSIYDIQGNTTSALECYERGLKIREEMGDQKNIAVALNNMAGFYTDMGNIAKALELYSRSLKIYELIDNQKGKAKVLNNIGLIYKNQGDLFKALEYFTKSLKISK